MKKFASLFMALVMICSLSVSAFAASNETVITYTGEGSEAYTITVPTTLEPGQSGTVRAEGTWATNRILKVTTADTVTVANSIDGGEKVLDVTFAGIEQAGDNETSITVSKTISVGDISDALFGTWTGVITYNVNMEDAKETATKWSYNGTELDALPTWNIEEYPYAFITYNTAGFYSLYVLSVEGGPSSTGNKTFVPTNETGYYMTCVLEDGKDFSKKTEFKYGFLASVTEGLIWANYDVKYKSTGDIYLSKSVPVPVLS